MASICIEPTVMKMTKNHCEVTGSVRVPYPGHDVDVAAHQPE
jgi:hypothetical protein